MSIADKLKTVAANMTAVYNAGKAAGGGNDELMKQVLEGTLAEITEDMFTNVAHLYVWKFQNFTKLTRVKLAPNIDYLYTGVFQNCKALEEVDLNQTRLAYGQIFIGCTALKKVTFSARVTQIGVLTFQNCTSLEVLDFSAAARVPTLGDVNVFTGVPSTCQVLIPNKLYEEWVNAANWCATDLTYVPVGAPCIFFDKDIVMPTVDGGDVHVFVRHYYDVDGEEASEEFSVNPGCVIEIPEGDEYSLEIVGDEDVNQFYFLGADGEWYVPGERVSMGGENFKIIGFPDCKGHTLSFAEDFEGQLYTANGMADTAMDLYCGEGEEAKVSLAEGIVPKADTSYSCVHAFTLYASTGDVLHDNCYAETTDGEKYSCATLYVLGGDLTIARIVCDQTPSDVLPYIGIGGGCEWLPAEELAGTVEFFDNCPHCGGKFYYGSDTEIIETSCPYCGEPFTIDAGSIVT